MPFLFAPNRQSAHLPLLSIRILSQLRAAAGTSLNVLIVDQIPPLTYRDLNESVLIPADSPLLSTLGKAYASSYH